MTKIELTKRVEELEGLLENAVKQAAMAEKLNEHHMQQMVEWSEAYGKLATKIDSLKNNTTTILNFITNFDIVRSLNKLTY